MTTPGVLANASFILANFGEEIGATIGLVDRALSLNPSFARGWNISALLRLYAGELDRAIEHAEDRPAPEPARAGRHAAGRHGSRLFLQAAVR